MFTSRAILPILLITSLPSLAQWAVGPSADLAMFRGVPRYIAYGIGASATYKPKKRSYWTANVAYHIPHIDHYIRVQDPRGMATGDTTSSTWRSNLHESHASITLGSQRTFNRRPRSMEWYWKVASGIILDRQRTNGVVTYKYSGEERPFGSLSYKAYVPLLAGWGRVWHVGRKDLALELSGMLPCYWITDKKFGARTRDYSMYLTCNYRWHI